MTHPLYQDLVPYDVPTSLDALRGPAEGQLDLPHALHWGPNRHVDLDEPADRVAMYQAVVREGSSAQQEALLNKTLLHGLWPELALPARCRETWQAAFPELRHPDRAASSSKGPGG